MPHYRTLDTQFDTHTSPFRLDKLSKPYTTYTSVPQLTSLAEYLGSTGTTRRGHKEKEVSVGDPKLHSMRKRYRRLGVHRYERGEGPTHHAGAAQIDRLRVQEEGEGVVSARGVKVLVKRNRFCYKYVLKFQGLQGNRVHGGG